MRYELQTPPVTADTIYDVVMIVLKQQHKNVCLISAPKRKKMKQNSEMHVTNGID